MVIKCNKTKIYRSISDWYNKVDSNLDYRTFKHKFEFEKYLVILPRNFLYYFTSFKTRNHKLVVENGRWARIVYNEWKCNLCKSEIEDEYHYLLTCKTLDTIRKEYLKPKYFKRPNIIKYENFINLMKQNKIKQSGPDSYGKNDQSNL